MTVTAEAEFGCLWCGATLERPDELFCDERCRRQWFVSDES